MEPITLVSILDALANLGALGAAGLVIFGLLTERIVPRSRLDEMRSDRHAGVVHSREAMSRFEKVELQVARLVEVVEEMHRFLLERRR